VYLAGGFGAPWQDEVKGKAGPFTYRDPSKHKIKDAAAYTSWDLEALRRSDIVFAYLHASNPTGYGLILEVGYAAALGKHVILVDEKSAEDEAFARQSGMVRQTANVHFTDLEEGIQYLKELSRISP
jgi:nucleoside 2-deoxyribosyltransferase